MMDDAVILELGEILEDIGYLLGRLRDITTSVATIQDQVHALVAAVAADQVDDESLGLLVTDLRTQLGTLALRRRDTLQ